MGYLLFVRSSAELGRACRDVSQFLGFQRRRCPAASHELHGVWIDAGAVADVPQVLIPPSAHRSDLGFATLESFGISEIWQLAWLHEQARARSDQPLPDRIVDALRGLSGGATGLFAPVFAGTASRSAMGEELVRLQHRYPGGLADPLIQDPHSGALDPLADLPV